MPSGNYKTPKTPFWMTRKVASQKSLAVTIRNVHHHSEFFIGHHHTVASTAVPAADRRLCVAEGSGIAIGTIGFLVSLSVNSRISKLNNLVLDDIT